MQETIEIEIIGEKLAAGINTRRYSHCRRVLVL